MPDGEMEQKIGVGFQGIQYSKQGVLTGPH